MADHPTKDVFNPFLGEDMPIDVDLAELMRRVWRRGIRTVGSCQQDDDWPQHHGKAYIVFETIIDAERFLNVAAGSFQDELESLYNRVVFNGSQVETDDDWHERRRFVVEAMAADLNRDAVWDDEAGDYVHVAYGPPNIKLSILVHFPREDIAELERRFALDDT